MTNVRINHKNFHKFLEPKYYLEALSFNSDAACVLRLQLLTEQFLNVLLHELPDNEQLPFLKAQYFDQKIQISVALGMPVTLATALKHLNKVRNRFAHDLDHTFDENRDLKPFINLINKFEVSIPGDAGSFTNLHYETTIVGPEVKEMKREFISVKDGIREGMAISTYILITKAGLWAIRALNQKDKLNVEKLESDDPFFSTAQTSAQT